MSAAPVLAMSALLVLGALRVEAATAAPVADGIARRHLVSVRDSPGWHPLADPESAAVALGRRTNAPAVRMPFHGGARSMDDLGRAVCGALHRASRDSLLSLCVADSEFRVILWPEFPQSRPAVGLQWDDAWRILWARLHAGCAHAVRDHGGHAYQFVSLTADSVMAYRNFTLYSRLTLVAKDDQGVVQAWRWLRAVAQRRGRFEIYSTED